ncbi:ester cyclase [Streptomyces sp. NPDC002454]|uniref:ester cyclase n=1 Tax=Streptomyces sp. NPDC002490 TaxID=3154416 RepID=UPI0033285FC9
MVDRAPSQSMDGYPFVDIVDFVERTTYQIWNDRRPELVPKWYPKDSVIWTDGGDLVGEEAVTADTAERRRGFSDYYGVIDDTIWTGDDESGYRTSMRWVARGTHDGHSKLGEPTGRRVSNSSISHCVVVGDQYVEEWAGGNALAFRRQLGHALEPAVAALRPSGMPTGEAAPERTRSLGATVPAVPEEVDGAGLFVTDLLNGLYNDRDLTLADRFYAPGAPYSFGTSRLGFGPAGARAEVERWHELLPDLHLEVEELYWNDDTPTRSRVAVRYRLRGTAVNDAGRSRPVSLMCFHHIHVRGRLVVAEWAEYNELALLAQVG